jgi:hypothetical protein
MKEMADVDSELYIKQRHTLVYVAASQGGRCYPGSLIFHSSGRRDIRTPTKKIKNVRSLKVREA